MRFVDLLALTLGTLFRQKVRSLLTTLAVVFGSFVLVASLSIRQGVHETIAREYSRYGELREITVSRQMYTPSPEVPAEKLVVRGAMSDSKRRRQGHNKQEGGHASQDHWIARGHAVEQAGCELSHFGDPTEADGFTGQHERQPWQGGRGFFIVGF